jgi:hypothetical protein
MLRSADPHIASNPAVHSLTIANANVNVDTGFGIPSYRERRGNPFAASTTIPASASPVINETMIPSVKPER